MAAPHTPVLRRCAIFSALGDDSIDTLADMARSLGFERGEMIFRQGEPCPGLYVVASGQVRIYKIAPNGKEHLLHLAGPGKTFAEVAVVGGFNCPAFAEATEASRCLLIPRAPLLAALDRDHKLCRQFLVGLALWARQLVGLMEDLVLRDAVGRVAHYLHNQTQEQTDARVVLPMLKKDLASHLNLTSETLSRTLRRLEESAIVSLASDQSMEIRDAQSLQDLARGHGPKI